MMIIPSGTASLRRISHRRLKVKILFRHLVVGAVLTQLASALLKAAVSSASSLRSPTPVRHRSIFCLSLMSQQRRNLYRRLLEESFAGSNFIL